MEKWQEDFCFNDLFISRKKVYERGALFQEKAYEKGAFSEKNGI